MKDVPMAAIRQAERDKIPTERSFSIAGSDIDPEALELCRRHIHQAGFDGQISVRQQDLRTLQVPDEPGVFLCNPPYGERLGDKREAEALYREMGLLLKRHPGWKLCAITSDFAFERCFGRRATHKRRRTTVGWNANFIFLNNAKTPRSNDLQRGVSFGLGNLKF